jgi:hypothetical protein
VYRERPSEVSQTKFRPLTHYQSYSPSTYPHQKSAKGTSSSNPKPQPPTTAHKSKTTYKFHGDSLHNTPPLLFLLLLRSEPHHLAVVAHGGSGSSELVVHVALERLVEPAADEPGRVAGHLGVAGAALAVVLAAALLVGQVAEEALGGGGGLHRVGMLVGGILGGRVEGAR